MDNTSFIYALFTTAVFATGGILFAHLLTYAILGHLEVNGVVTILGCFIGIIVRLMYALSKLSFIGGV